MNLELTEQEARMVRAQLVRHIVELEDELSRAQQNALERALAVEIRSLREVYGRLTSMLDSASPPSGIQAGMHAAKYAR
ncbi:MAG: hypothetical protein ABSC94_04370 [Polyangiaceae bacterium]|jgi:hypothetical protein